MKGEVGNMASVSEVLKTLAEWTQDCGGELCSTMASEGRPCRHERARDAIVEVNNAVAEVDRVQVTK